MDKEKIKNRIDFNNIQEKIIIDKLTKDEFKHDYLVDFEGNYIIPLTPLDIKLIEWIKALELRIIELEGK